MFGSLSEEYFHRIFRLLMNVFRVKVPEENEERTWKHHLLLFSFHTASSIFGLLVPALVIVLVIVLLSLI